MYTLRRMMAIVWTIFIFDLLIFFGQDSYNHPYILAFSVILLFYLGLLLTTKFVSIRNEAFIIRIIDDLKNRDSFSPETESEIMSLRLRIRPIILENLMSKLEEEGRIARQRKQKKSYFKLKPLEKSCSVTMRMHNLE